jgi:hypothetical protein
MPEWRRWLDLNALAREPSASTQPPSTLRDTAAALRDLSMDAATRVRSVVGPASSAVKGAIAPSDQASAERTRMGQPSQEDFTWGSPGQHPWPPVPRAPASRGPAAAAVTTPNLQCDEPDARPAVPYAPSLTPQVPAPFHSIVVAPRPVAVVKAVNARSARKKLHLSGGPKEIECSSCGRLEKVDAAAMARAELVERAGFSLDEWEKLIRSREANSIRPALLQRLLRLSFEEASSRLGRATQLGLLVRLSELRYNLTPLRCSVCQRQYGREEDAVSVATVEPSSAITSEHYERERIPAQMRFRVLTRDNFRCRYCGRTRDDGAILHLDHVIPVSNGGETSEANLLTACDRCNLGKSASSVLPTLG